MSESYRPRIAVAWVRPDNAADARYLDALARAGAIVLPAYDDGAWEDTVLAADGVLFTGGGDIDPSLYDEAASAAVLQYVNGQRDSQERAVFALARARGLPVLGICRGMQLMNVLYVQGPGQGTLAADLPQTPVRHRAVNGDSSYHSVTVVAGTRLASLVGGAGEYRVNSRHHQGAYPRQVATGLVIAATAPDGLVEAVEARGEPFFLGVQCHPERDGEAPAFAAVFRGLVEAARERRTQAASPRVEST